MNASDSSESPILIYLLAQNRLVREVIARLFRKQYGITMVGNGHDIADALEIFATTPCDVLLLDSMEILRMLRREAKLAECIGKISILLFGMKEDPECFLEAVRLGVSGYLLNDASAAETTAAVRDVRQGKVICPPILCKVLFKYVSTGSPMDLEKVERRGYAGKILTCRQRQLMALVAKGMTNKEIATSLHLSEFTIKNHVHRILAQLKAESRHHAVDVIQTQGLFPIA